MSILRAFQQGLATTRRRSRLILYLWLANLFFGVLVLGPFIYLAGRDFGSSLEGDRLLQGVDFIWLGDVILNQGDALAGLAGWALIPFSLYLVWSIFSSGGILGRIAAEEEKTTLAAFVSDGCQYFFRFFRVPLIAIPVYVIVFGLLYKLLNLPLAAWSRTAGGPWGDFWASTLGVLVFLALFSLVRILFDYARIRLVVDRSRKAFRAVVMTFGFLGGRLVPAWALYLLIAAVSVVVLALFLLVSRLLTGASGAMVLVVWLQVLAAVRQGIRILFLASESHYYKGSQL
ncbi:MAG: hypothetical protein JW742_02875 [Candidatus Aminicenantes bacterium]|nr:hypothetical protein [Candidatus Aminicenantes bacterium]